MRDARVRLGDDRGAGRGHRLHPRDDREHLGGAVAAVATDRRRTVARELRARVLGGQSHHRPAVRVERHRHDHRQVRRGAPDALERRVALLDGGERLDPEQVHPAPGEGRGLLLEDRDGVLERERAERLEDLAGRPDVAGDERVPAALLDLGAREHGGGAIELGHALLEVVHREARAVSAERVREHDLRAGLEVAAVHLAHELGMQQVPGLRRLAEAQAVLEEQGPHRAVGERGRRTTYELCEVHGRIIAGLERGRAIVRGSHCELVCGVAPTLGIPCSAMAHLPPERLSFLRELLRAHGPSGHEGPAAEVWRAEAETFARVDHDVLGSSFAAVGPSEGAPVLLLGHIDEIGLIVSHIEDGEASYGGKLRVRPLGGWDPRCSSASTSSCAPPTDA